MLFTQMKVVWFSSWQNQNSAPENSVHSQSVVTSKAQEATLFPVSSPPYPTGLSLLRSMEARLISLSLVQPPSLPSGASTASVPVL